MTGIVAARTAVALGMLMGLAGAANASGQIEQDRADARSRGFDGYVETERFAVFWRTEEASAEQVRELVPTADAYFERISALGHSGFWEEGFAEAIAMAVDPDDVGFPRYGYPLTVAAGHLLAWDEYIPLAEVRARHREMGRRCQLQAYLERASFFHYLVERRGITSLIELTYGPHSPTEDDFQQVYGKPFDELVTDWETRLLADYRATVEADETARRYRAEPPIRSRPMCASS
jgi:hypothetical protein